MPTVKIFVDPSVSEDSGLQDGLIEIERQVGTIMQTEISKVFCMIIPTLSGHAEKPAHVQIEYLPNATRTPEFLTEAAQEIGSLIGGTLGVPVRLRLWSAKDVTMGFVDVTAPGEDA